MKHVVSLASLVALVAITPAVGHAQFIFGGGDAPDPSKAALPVNPGIPSSTPGILSQDDTNPGIPINADSLAHAKAFAKSHHPVVIIDHKVKAASDFNSLKAASIATYKLQEASDKDVTYYGNNAKNGIITVTLVPAPAPPTKKKKR